jgi:hypothetical protein
MNWKTNLKVVLCNSFSFPFLFLEGVVSVFDLMKAAAES